MTSGSAEAYRPAAEAALAAFPIQPRDLTPIAMAENVTFRVTDASDGAAYVLRLHRPGYHDLRALNAERLWTAALAEAGVGVPRGVRSRGGDWYVPITIPSTDEMRYAGLATWTEGELLSDILEREGPAAAAAHFCLMGAEAAALHNQASGWRPPAGFVRHSLDCDGLMGEAPFWGRFWESPALSPAEQALTLATRLKIAAALRRLGKDADSYGLIHADLHPGNVLVRDGALSVIDFDDSGFGWHAYDIAVALFYQQRSADFAFAQAAFLAGYRRVRRLSAATEGLIPMFLLIRGLAVIGWLSQRPELDPTRFMDQMKAPILQACEAFEAPV